MKTRILLVVTALIVGLAATLPAQMTKYGVKVETANKAALATVKTYGWVPGQPAFDKTVDKAIVSAIDRELGARGMKPATASPDAQVTYMSIRRTDVDLKAKPDEKTGALPQYPVGTLVVSMTDPATKKPIYTARIDKPITLEMSKLEPMVHDIVAELFQTFPRSAGK